MYGLTDASRQWYCRMGTFTVGNKEDTNLVYVGWDMKWSRQGITVSQGNHTKKVDNLDVGAYNYRDGEKVLKENEQSHFRKLMESINCLAMNLCRVCACMPNLCLYVMEMNGESRRIYTISWKNGKLSRTARSALAAEVQAATNIMGEEMQGLDEGTTGLGLTTDSKSLQEVCQIDNQSEDKGTGVDTAVLRRSGDMNIYISSKETSRNEHPQHYVEIANPLAKPGACRNWLRQALMSGQVDTRFQFRCVSKEPETNVQTKKFSMFYSITQQARMFGQINMVF